MVTSHVPGQLISMLDNLFGEEIVPDVHALAVQFSSSCTTTHRASAALPAALPNSTGRARDNNHSVTEAEVKQEDEGILRACEQSPIFPALDGRENDEESVPLFVTKGSFLGDCS